MYDYLDMKREICMVLTFDVMFPVQPALLLFIICKPISYNWHHFFNQWAEYPLKIEQLDKSNPSHSFHTKSFHWTICTHCRLWGILDSTVAMNFVHCEVKNVLERQLDRMNNHIIQMTKTTTGIITVIMRLGRWWWWRQRLLRFLLFIINMMQGTYNYIPKTNCVPMEYNVTAILWLQLWIPLMLYPLINVLCCWIYTFWTMCAVPSRVFFL